MAVCCRNDNRRGGRAFCDGGGGQVPSTKAGWNFHFDIKGGQKSSGGLNKAVTAENKSAVEFGQLDERILGVGIGKPAIRIRVALERIRNELFGAFRTSTESPSMMIVPMFFPLREIWPILQAT